MGKEKTEYKINCATREDVYAHLAKCDKNFVPALSARMNIREYADKIKTLSVTFEAWHNGSLAGLLAAYVNDTTRKAAFITNVSVVTNMMGKGIASELLSRAVRYITEKNFKEIRLEVNKENQPAIRFYSKFNFLQAGINSDSLTMKKKVQQVT